MAALNVTGTPTAVDAGLLSHGILLKPELEKISCSVRGNYAVHPLELMGKRIRFAETISLQIDIGDGNALQSYISTGTVLAVQLGSIEHGIETSLLVEEPGCTPAYCDIQTLTILDVIE
jgi:hypothetical protein